MVGGVEVVCCLGDLGEQFPNPFSAQQVGASGSRVVLLLLGGRLISRFGRGLVRGSFTRFS